MARAGYREGNREEDRDISEKIALGQAQPSTKEAMYDQRLFNQAESFKPLNGEDDDYNLYDKPLFADRTAATIYKNVKNIDVSKYTGNEDQANSRVRKVLGAAEGEDVPKRELAEKSGRSRPVEFDKTVLETADQEEGYRPGLQKRQRRD